MPKTMVYVLIVLSMSLLLGLAVVGFLFNNLPFGITFLVLFVVYGILLVCFRKLVDMGIILLKAASQFIS
jgi:hypothetical protein